MSLLLEIPLAIVLKKALHSSCFNLEDGSRHIQILTNEELSLLSQSEQDYYLTAPIVHVKCHSGYTIIDPSFDSSWMTYFSSFHQWKSETAGPDLDDHVTWNEWFLPSLKLHENINTNTNTNINDIDITYTISPDCKKCIINDNQYNNKVYYMSGDIFGCHWPINSDNDSENEQCVYDNLNQYSDCSKCYTNNQMYYSSNCGSMIYDANTPIFSDHSHCFEEKDANKIPAIGTDGRYCVCYKPKSTTMIKHANWDDMAIDNVNDKHTNDNVNDYENVYIELYESDFDDGTYRILKAGTYKIMENIRFNFNPGGVRHPNGGEFAWRPSSTDYYTNYYTDYYTMNWFAGIIIECDDVIIDLNNHILGMEYLFYLQNRFFTIISLTNKLFTDANDGMTFMSSKQQISANNIVIKNGIIGLTSHMSIFGINNENIKVLNVHIKDFETHGIVFNKYKNLIMKNIEIGPSIGIDKELKLNTRYTNARLMLPIFYNVAKQNTDGVVYFHHGGQYTMSDIIARLIVRMDLAFEYVINGLDNINSNEGNEGNEWEEAKKLFINDNGVSEYTTIYGLLLKGSESNAMIEDLYIHDLIIAPKQVIKIGISDDLWLRNPFNAPIDLSIAIKNELNDSTNINDAIYYGDVLTDALVALRQLSDSWWLLGRIIIWDEFIEWTQTNKPLNAFYKNNNENNEIIKEICGYDIVTGSSKGVIGINIESSYDITMKNIVIENLINMGNLQHSNCNNTYFGNNVRGISILNSKNINIEQLNVNKIISFNGASYGIYYDDNNNESNNESNNNSTITLNYAKFSHIDAGIKSSYDGIDISKALSCSIYCVNDINDINCNNYIKYYDMEEQCMNGQIKCINQMMIHHECQIDVDYNTPIGIIYVNKYGEINAEWKSFQTNNKNNSPSIIFRGEYFACTIIVFLAILAAIKCIYFKRTNDKRKKQTTNDENSPLLYDNDQIDYDNL